MISREKGKFVRFTDQLQILEVTLKGGTGEYLLVCPFKKKITDELKNIS